MRKIQFLLLLALIPAIAEARPGVGYSAVARGYRMSCFMQDNLGTPYICQPLNEASDWQSLLPVGGPALVAAFEARYGKCTFGASCPGHSFKRWPGPGNEVKFMVSDALAWMYQTNPAALGGDTSNRDGIPTDQEVTDAQATNDQIWQQYMTTQLPGYASDKPIHYNNINELCGLQLVKGQPPRDPFWGLAVYRFNDPPCGVIPTPMPTPVPLPVPTPSPVATPPPPVPCATSCPTCVPETHKAKRLPVKDVATLRAGLNALGKKWDKLKIEASKLLDELGSEVYVPDTRSTGQLDQH